MKLEIEGEVISKNPTSEDISKALSSLDGENKNFVILEHNKLTYIQASGSAKDGFSLEYQNGSLKQHFSCPTDLSLSEAIKIFQVYARDEKEWQTIVDWKPMKMRTKSGFHPEKPKISHSPLSLLMYALVILSFVAVFFGSKKGANLRLWMSVLFSCAALIVATGTTQGLKAGRFRSNFFTVTRSENPFQFWTAVDVGYLFSLLIITGLIVFLVKPQ